MICFLTFQIPSHFVQFDVLFQISPNFLRFHVLSCFIFVKYTEQISWNEPGSLTSEADAVLSSTPTRFNDRVVLKTMAPAVLGWGKYHSPGIYSGLGIQSKYSSERRLQGIQIKVVGLWSQQNSGCPGCSPITLITFLYQNNVQFNATTRQSVYIHFIVTLFTLAA